MDGVVDGTQQVEVTYDFQSLAEPFASAPSVTRSLDVTDTVVAPGLVLAPDTLADLAEGVTVTVTVKLTSSPAANVTVAFTADATELSFSTANLVFTSAEWNTPKVVELTGVKDILVDGTQQVVVTYDISSTDGSAYNDLDSVTQSLGVTDVDIGAVSFAPAFLPDIDEEGAMSTATVILSLSAPAEPGVTLAIRSFIPSAATLSADSISVALTTTSDSATVTISAVPNFLDDGNHRYGVTVSVVEGGPPGYVGLNASPNPLALLALGDVIDNDEVGLVLDPPPSLPDFSLPDLDEGQTATLKVRLAAVPTRNVRVSILLSEQNELAVFVQMTGAFTVLVFRPTNWNVPQPVTLSAVVDNAVDANQVVMMTLGIRTQAASNYASLPNVILRQNIIDVDEAGLVADPTTLPNINEEGGTATVTVRLLTAADPGVQLSFTSPFPAVATLTETPLLVTLTTLADRVTVTLGAVDDTAANGNRPYALKVSVVSGHGGYDGLTLSVAGARVFDNDAPGLVLDPPVLPDLKEAHAEFDDLLLLDTPVETQVMVYLAKQPTAAVTVSISSSDPSELTVSVARLVFGVGNWDTPQPVTLSGVEDMLLDGPKPVTVIYDYFSSDASYGTLSVVNQTLEVIDLNQNGGASLLSGGAPDIRENRGPVTVGLRLNLLFATAVEPRAVLNISTNQAFVTLSAPSIQVTLTTLADRMSVTLFPVNDMVDTGNRRYTFFINTHVDGLSDKFDKSQAFHGNFLEDDEANLVLDPSTLPDLAENATSTVSVKLATPPLADVTVSVSSGDTGDFLVSPAQLMFTTTNWNAEQPVTLSGVPDSLADGPHEVAVNFETSSADDPYNDLPVVSQALSVTDATPVGLVAEPTPLPNLSEDGGRATVTLRLVTAAETAVTMSITSLSHIAPLISAPLATLTTLADRVTVTLRAINNTSIGNSQYALSVSVVSGPGNYNGLSLSFSGMVVDDDVPNLLLDPFSLLDVTEGGETQVMVKLSRPPSSAVSVAVSSSDPDELTVSIDELVFTTGTWSRAQPVTLSGKEDSLIDGTQTVVVTYGLSSSDTRYGNLPDVTQTLDVTDSDVAGVVPDPTTLPTIDEEGETSTATVTLRLATNIEDVAVGVTLAFTSPFPAVATLSAMTLRATLTTTTDSVTVTLGAVNDDVDGNDRDYGLKVSVVDGPAGYAGLEMTVTGSVRDDDTSNLMLDPSFSTLLTFAESGTSQVTVKLATMPSAIVTVAISSSDSEQSNLIVSHTQLVFTADNWDTDQTVTLTGVEDSLVDGTKTEMLTYDLSSSDTRYGNLPDVTQTLNVTDSDNAIIRSDPTTLPNINEEGESSTATVTLSLETTAASGVTLDFTSPFPAVATLTLSETPLRATLTTTSDRATVTLGAVANNSDTGNRPYALLVSVVGGPGGYSGLKLSVTGMVTDDDVANLLLAPTTLPNVTEIGETQVNVMLATQPSADVTVSVSSSETGEATVSPARLVFTAESWNVAKPVTLSGVEDNLVDGTQEVIVTYDLSSIGDSDYDDLTNVTQSLGVTDADTASFTFIPTALPDIPELGGMVTVSVHLGTAADSNVELALTSLDTTAATLTGASIPATLLATANVAVVTLFAVDDGIDHLINRRYGLRVSVTSGPAAFVGLTQIVEGSLTDDDVANLVLVPSSLTLALAEGATRMVTVKLATEPTANVNVAVASDDDTELLVSPASLVFMTDNWDTDQTVTLTGVRDSLVDGMKQVMVTYDISSTGDSAYHAVSNVTQPLTVTDSDIAGFDFLTDPPTLPSITENGGVAVVALSLATAAESGVELSFTSLFTAVATLSPASLRATLTLTADKATVTLGTVDNPDASGDQTYALKVSVMSGPGSYADLELTVTGTAEDDDVPNLVLDPPSPSLPVVAEGGERQVMVNLATRPTSGVTVAVSSSETGELTVSPAELVFTRSDWNTAKAVMLSGAEDNLVDGSQTVEVTYAVTSLDSDYGGLGARTQSQVVTDSDVGGLALFPAAAALPPLSEPDGMATVSLRLTRSSSSPVMLAVWSSDPSIVTLSSATLTLTLMDEMDRGAVELGAVDNSGTGNNGYFLMVSVLNAVGGYADLTLTVHGMLIDDDAPNLVLSPTPLPAVAEGAISMVMVNLGTVPIVNVTVSVSSSETGELTVSPATLVFTPDDWDEPQAIALTGVTDGLVDGTQAVMVTFDSSSSGEYNTLSDVTLSQDVTDAEIAALLPDPTTLTNIPEDIGTVAVTISLMTTAETGVELSFSSSVPEVATVSSRSLRATLRTTTDSATVTLEVIDDDEANVNKEFALLVTVVTGPGGYSGLGLSIAGMVIDDDVPNLVLNPNSPQDVTEVGESQVSVRLATQPSDNVTVAVTVSDDTELLVSPAQLVFTTTDWSTAKAVTLSGVEDNLVDETKQVMVTYDISSTGDSDYGGLDSVTQSLDVTDSDTAALIPAPATLPSINEPDGTAEVILRLSVAVETGVELSFTSLIPGVATLTAPSPLRATLTTLDDRATVTLGAVDDDEATGNQRYALLVSVESGPGGYSGLSLSVTGMVVDDDIPNLVLALTPPPAVAENGERQVMVKLATLPSDNVTVSVSSSDEGEATVSPARLVFTNTSWDTELPVTLSGVADNLVDGTQAVVVTYDSSSNGDIAYNRLSNVTQTLSVTDVDTAGLETDPPTLPSIPENGGVAVVVLSLATAAEPGVEMSFTSLFTAVATLSSTPLFATLRALDDRATVTLGTVDNPASSGDQTYALKVSVMSGPGGYADLELTVTGTAEDDDVPALVLDPPSPSLPDVAEDATSTVSVMLATQPSANVTVAVTVSDDTELLVSPANLVFMPDDWNTAQAVTLSGVPDSLVDGTKQVTVTYDLSSSGPGSSGDSGYDDLPDVTQSLDVTDEDDGSFVFIPGSLPNIGENGGTAVVSVRLATAAETAVTLALTSLDSPAATLTAASIPATLIATANVAVVTLFAVDDSIDTPSNRRYGLRVSVTSGQDGYVGLTQIIAGSVTDDDVARLMLDPPTLSDLAEGAMSAVMVSLATEPTQDVTVSVSSSDEGEMTVSTSPLVFRPDSWNTAQTVTLSGIEDRLVDETQTVAVTYVLSSRDRPYNNVPNVTQPLSVTDADIAGLKTEPTTLPPINEDGDTAIVAVGLMTAVETAVTLSFTSPDPAATLSSSLRATLRTLDDRARVTLRAVANDAASGNQPYSLQVSVVSGPGGYSGLSLSVGGGLVIDDDVPNLVLDRPSRPVVAEGGETQVSVMLATQPSANVTVAVTVSDDTELTVSPASLVFTADDWNAAQAVTLSGVPDSLVDGTKQVMVTYDLSSSGPGPSGDSDYNALADVLQALNVTDEDVAGLRADQTTLPSIGENGGTAMVILRLLTASEPGVALSFTSPFPAVATLSAMPLRATLTTLDDRATVTLGAVNDNIDRNDRGYALKVSVESGPGGYANLELTVSGSVTDDDVAALMLDPPTLSDLAEGAMSAVMVSLATEPTQDVTVSVSSSDEGEMTVSTSPLVFRPDNWNTAQTVTLSGIADSLVDETQTVAVTYVLSSRDRPYNDVPNVTQPLSVTDADIAGLKTEPTTLPSINEDGDTAIVAVGLMTAVETAVTLSFTSPDPAATLSSSLRATLRTLDDRARVTLRAVANDAASGNQPYSLQVSVVSGPGGYSGLSLSVGGGIVIDDDVPNLVLDRPSRPVVAEGGETQVMVRLATLPSANVTVAVTVSDVTELTVSPASLVFRADNWDTDQTVTLSGVEDNLVDGMKQVMVTYDLSSSGPGSSGDSDYDGLPNVTQALDVTDEDVAGLRPDPTTLPSIGENGGTAVVALTLLTAAEGGVTLSFTSPFPEVARLSPTSITATLTTTAHRATVTLRAVNDDIDRIDRGYALKVSVVSGPGGYANLELTVSGSVTDDDVANLMLAPPTLSDLAEGVAYPVMVKLASEPIANVTVSVTSSDPGELRVSPTQLEFTADDWNAGQPVTLSGREDNLVDGTQTVMVTYAASSSDNNYGGLAAVPQSQDVTDSDVGGLALEPVAASLPALSEPDGVATVSLRLTKPSTSPVTLAVWSSATSVATLSSATVMLTMKSAADLGAVTLGAVDNDGMGNRNYELRVSVVDGVGGYDGVMLSVPGTVIDDDAVGVRFVVPGSPRLMEGGSLTVSVALGATPTAAVTLEVSSTDTMVATLSPATVTLTLDGPLASAPVIVSGVTNTLLADQTYELTVSVVGSGADYNGQVASTSGIVVSDDATLVAEPAELGEFLRRNGPATVEVTLRLERIPAMSVTVIIDNFNSEYATLLGPSQSQTATLGASNDSVTLTLVTVDDEGIYPREFGLRVMVTTGNAADVGFNRVFTLRGTVIESRLSSEATAMLQVAVADIAAAGLAIDLVADNINGGPSDGPRAQIGGRSVTGLSATVGVSPSRPPDAWNDSDPWSEAGEAEWKDGMGLVPGSGFVLPLSSGAGTGTSTELWGGARYSDLSGEPAIGGVRHSYDGDAVAMHVGMTRRFASGTSAGLAIGHTWVDLEVSAEGDDSVVKASRRLVSVHPYVSLPLLQDTRLLLLAGYGDGTYRAVGDETRKASMRMVAARLERDWQAEGFDLSGKLGVLSVESKLKADEDAAAQRGGSFQSRVELEFSKSYAPGEGTSLRPYGSLGYLHESGTVDTEGGVEIGAGLRGAWIAGLDADLSARYQLDGAKRSERKLEGRLSYDPGLDRRGLLLDASQEHSLSEEEDGSASVESEYTVRLGHGWGRTLWRRHGVLGTYVSTVEGSGSGFHGPRLGLSFEAASLELVAEQGFDEGRFYLNYVTNF